MFKVFSSIVAIASLAAASPSLANAITLDSGDVGTTFSLGFDGFSGDASSTVSGLTSDISFTLDSVTSNQYNFSYVVNNTTSSGLTSNLSSFAFDTNPEIAGATATGAYSYTILDGSYPNQVGNVDVCFKAANSGSCAGNQGGVAQGSTGSGTLSLSFADALTSLTLSEFFVRYQGITGAGNVSSASGQAVSSSSTSGGSTTGGTPVPAPGMLALFAAALAALGFTRRRPAASRKQDVAFA